MIKQYIKILIKKRIRNIYKLNKSNYIYTQSTHM